MLKLTSDMRFYKYSNFVTIADAHAKMHECKIYNNYTY